MPVFRGRWLSGIVADDAWAVTPDEIVAGRTTAAVPLEERIPYESKRIRGTECRRGRRTVGTAAFLSGATTRPCW